MEGLDVPFKQFVLTASSGIQKEMFKGYKPKPYEYCINGKVFFLLSNEKLSLNAWPITLQNWRRKFWILGQSSIEKNILAKNSEKMAFLGDLWSIKRHLLIVFEKLGKRQVPPLPPLPPTFVGLRLETAVKIFYELDVSLFLKHTAKLFIN